MFDVAIKQLLMGMSTASVSITPPDRVSMMAFGVMDTSGLRSLPDKNNAEKEPAWSTLSGTGETMNVTPDAAPAGTSRVAIEELSERTAVMAAASLAATACVVGTTLEVKFGMRGQADAALADTHTGCALASASRSNLPCASRRSPHQTGSAGMGQENLRGWTMLDEQRCGNVRCAYGPLATAQLWRDATQTPGRLGHSNKPTGHPFHG
jgi:hypothetical protein